MTSEAKTLEELAERHGIKGWTDDPDDYGFHIDQLRALIKEVVGEPFVSYYKSYDCMGDEVWTSKPNRDVLGVKPLYELKVTL